VLTEQLPPVEGYMSNGLTTVEVYDQTFSDLPEDVTALAFLTSFAGVDEELATEECDKVGAGDSRKGEPYRQSQPSIDS
jgi:hypothetical protein